MSGTEHDIGRVKWFNNKSGYGFITYGDDDIFVHHTGLAVNNRDMFKYLVEGEYVSFRRQQATGTSHKWQASDVTGVNGGPLMCETREERRPDGARSERTMKNRASASASDSVNNDDGSWEVADGSRHIGM